MKGLDPNFIDADISGMLSALRVKQAELKHTYCCMFLLSNNVVCNIYNAVLHAVCITRQHILLLLPSLCIVVYTLVSLFLQL